MDASSNRVDTSLEGRRIADWLFVEADESRRLAPGPLGPHGITFAEGIERALDLLGYRRNSHAIPNSVESDPDLQGVGRPASATPRGRKKGQDTSGEALGRTRSTGRATENFSHSDGEGGAGLPPSPATPNRVPMREQVATHIYATIQGVDFTADSTPASDPLASRTANELADDIMGMLGHD
jgi:hypothetical protein